MRKRARKYALGGGVPATPPEPTAPEPVAVADVPIAPAPTLSADATAALDMPPLAKSWLRDNPEYLSDARKNARLQALHWEIVDQGFEPYGEKYFEEINDRLGEGPKITPPTAVDRVLAEARAASTPTSEDDDGDGVDYLQSESGNALRIGAPSRKVSVSAPPSRQVPSSNGYRDDGRITLTIAQKEAARISGVDESTYARQLLELNRRKAQGDYGGSL